MKGLTQLLWRARTKDEQRLMVSFWLVGILAAVVVGVGSPPHLVGDEGRYLHYAENLTQGFYVKADHPDFTNGPGYPLILAPFVAMKAPWWMMRGCNVVFLLGAMWFMYQTVRIWCSPRWALVAALVLALNPVLFRYMGQMKTEVLSTMLFAGFLWSYVRVLQAQRWAGKRMLVCVGFLFALIMVRVLFGYVAMAGMVVLPLFLWISGQMTRWKAATAPLGGALILCLPWLVYTHHYTEKFPCWSTNGGELFYWMTSPYPEEWGSWFSYEEATFRPEIAQHHGDFLHRVEALPFAEREAVYLEQAKMHLAEHPQAFVRNLTANVSRILFSFPRSYYS
ncbi:MAG: glycosyltransferase family 39 protein, partial [Verrucomicrobiota bacterium]